MIMSNSSLVAYKLISPNRTRPRSQKIDRITIHHMAANSTIEGCGSWFSRSSTQASSNYGIGSDGRIGLYVEEKDRSWCSSSGENDNRAVTIEVADWKTSDGKWHVSDAAYKSLINLCVDICKRNGIASLNYTGDTSGNLTMHKWFANTDCPGNFLEPRFKQIADEVNKKLGTASTTDKTTIDAPSDIGGNDMTRGYFKQGDANEGVYAYKQLLIALKAKKIITQGVDDNNIFGAGTTTATKQVQKAAGITVDGLAGAQTLKACRVLLTK